MPTIGAHVSAAGGVRNAPLNARKEGCDVFQFFVSPPQSYAMPPLSTEEIADFQKNCRTNNFTTFFVHAPYIVNLASPNNRVRHGSITALRKTLERCSVLGVHGMMFHTGSVTGQPSKSAGIAQAIEAINKILDGYSGSTKLLIENAAGAGNTIGVHFEEIAQLLDGVGHPEHIGVCLDTQHAFASGYDWRTKQGIDAALKEFSQHIGMKKLMCIQANDSKTPFDSHRDRHEHIGKGHIGVEAFRMLLHHDLLRTQPFLCETEPTLRSEDVALLKKLA